MTALETQILGQIEPLDLQMGVHPPQIVPSDLEEVLFDGPEHTYAILDAAKSDGFSDAIRSSGLRHRCLFTGDAEEELGDVAPWLVQLTADASFARQLFSADPGQDFLKFYWAAEPGIYLRSRHEFDTIWSHFRKFTRVRDEAGRWFYLRFWEPRWSETLLRDMTGEDRQNFIGPATRLIILRADAESAVLSLGEQTEVPQPIENEDNVWEPS